MRYFLSETLEQLFFFSRILDAREFFIIITQDIRVTQKAKDENEHSCLRRSDVSSLKFRNNEMKFLSLRRIRRIITTKLLGAKVSQSVSKMFERHVGYVSSPVVILSVIA